jgi:hypothetical protein
VKWTGEKKRSYLTRIMVLEDQSLEVGELGIRFRSSASKGLANDRQRQHSCKQCRCFRQALGTLGIRLSRLVPEILRVTAMMGFRVRGTPATVVRCVTHLAAMDFLEAQNKLNIGRLLLIPPRLKAMCSLHTSNCGRPMSKQGMPRREYSYSR